MEVDTLYKLSDPLLLLLLLEYWSQIHQIITPSPSCLNLSTPSMSALSNYAVPKGELSYSFEQESRIPVEGSCQWIRPWHLWLEAWGRRRTTMRKQDSRRSFIPYTTLYFPQCQQKKRKESECQKRIHVKNYLFKNY